MHWHSVIIRKDHEGVALLVSFGEHDLMLDDKLSDTMASIVVFNVTWFQMLHKWIDYIMFKRRSNVHDQEQFD